MVCPCVNLLAAVRMYSTLPLYLQGGKARARRAAAACNTVHCIVDISTLQAKNLQYTWDAQTSSTKFLYARDVDGGDVDGGDARRPRHAIGRCARGGTRQVA
jgi:hypothetical protein